MKELEFIDIIKKTLTKTSYIGDDCAYLKELGLVVTHDSLVEDVHFCRKFSSPKDIAYKSLVVNISDILASGAEPKYLTISLSLPKDVDSEFVKEFYQSVECVCNTYDVEVVGGDITGSDKIFVSICAIGLTSGRNISSRSYAEAGDVVIVKGLHGSSSAGLLALQKGVEGYCGLKGVHLNPIIQKEFSRCISTRVKSKYAMMDTSDGLADALLKIASASNVLIKVDFEKVPFDDEIIELAKLADVDYHDLIFYGGEDFSLIACLSREELENLDCDYVVIGQVCEKANNHFVEIDFGNNTEKIYDLEKSFNHFKE